MDFNCLYHENIHISKRFWLIAITLNRWIGRKLFFTLFWWIMFLVNFNTKTTNFNLHTKQCKNINVGVGLLVCWCVVYNSKTYLIVREVHIYIKWIVVFMLYILYYIVYCYIVYILFYFFIILLYVFHLLNVKDQWSFVELDFMIVLLMIVLLMI